MRELDETRADAQSALNSMSRNGVLATPQNFATWFAYATRAWPELVAEINGIMESGGGFTADVNDDLHDRHITQESPQDSRDSKDSGTDARAVITAELLHTLRILQEAFDASEAGQMEFHEKLERYAERLESAKSPADIGRIVSEMVLDTVQVREQTDELKTRLADSSARISELDSKLATTSREAVTDPLTGIANRRYFDREFGKAVAQAEKNALPLSLIYLDIDRFKAFNDEHGHYAGDMVLKLVAEQIASCVGPDGFACRFGGEEFVVLLKNTGGRQALVIAEQIRILICRREVRHRKSGTSLGRISISGGLAQLQPAESPDSLLKRADDLLYEAKESGRNSVRQSVTGKATEPSGEEA